MVFEWPSGWVATLNVVSWPVVQISLGWIFTKMPAHWFAPPGPYRWESGGKIYERIFRVRHWKDRLPDGAQWFEGGFAKSRLGPRRPEQLQRFLLETWRGELCHWGALAFAPVFVLWNPPWAAFVMMLCGLLLNLPCIVALRYNRARLHAVLGRCTTSGS